MPVSVGLFCDAFPPAIDGVTSTVHNYAKWLAKMEHDCSVVVPATPRVVYDEPFRVLTFSSLPLSQRPPYRMGLPGIDLRLHEQLRKIKPDLVHAHTPFGAGMEALHYANVHEKPLVTTFHSKYYDDFLQATRSPFIARKMLQSVIRFYEKADRVWTVNHSTAETMREYGFRGPIEIMPNGTDLQLPADADKRRAQVNERYALDSDESVLLFVGQHIWQKNVRMMLQAVARLHARIPNFRLLMVGTGYASEEMALLAKSLGIGDNVIFVGAVQDRDWLCSIYLRADLFIFPSVYDNAPLVLREAAAMECPTVLVRGTNAAKDTQDGVNAFWCGNSEQLLCERIQELLDAPDERLRVGRCARETLARSWEEIMQKVEVRYEQIVEEHSYSRIRSYIITKNHVRRAKRKRRK